jgi:hypothetical protein
MVQSDKKNDQIRSLIRYQIRSLKNEKKFKLELTPVLDQQGVEILIQA